MLESSNVKLGSVLSDLFGVSGRNILARLLEKGYVDKDELDQCLRGRLKTKKQAVYDSLLGTLTEHELRLLRLLWKHVEELEQLIEEVDQHIDRLLEPYREEVDLLMTMPGIKKQTAAVIIAEMGTDMSVFETPERVASWTGCPPATMKAPESERARVRLKAIPIFDQRYARRHGQQLDPRHIPCPENFGRWRPMREEKSPHRHGSTNVGDHLLHDLPQRVVPPTTTYLV